MKIELKLLKAKKETADGFPLVFEIAHQNKRKQKEIAKCKLIHFIEDHKTISTKHPDYDILIEIINEYKIKSKKIILSGVKDVEKAYKLLFEYEVKIPDFETFFELVLKEMKIEIDAAEKRGDLIFRNKASGNYAVYQNVRNKFLPYGKNISIDEIDYNLLMSFRTDLQIEGLSKNSIHLYLRTLRALYNKAVKKYQITDKKPFSGVFDRLKVKSFDNKKKYIDKNDIFLLENYKGLKGEVEKVDLFLLQFYFGGCDLIDLYFMKKSQLKKNRVYFERGKTNTGILIDLALHPKAQNIINKYKDFDAEYIFPFRKDIEGYKTFRTRYLKLLKKVQEKLKIEVKPLGGNLGVKVARHTFANAGKLLNIDPDILRELMGHERDDVDNYYKDKFPEKIRDKALFEIIEC